MLTLLSSISSFLVMWPKFITIRSISSCFSLHPSVEIFRLINRHFKSLTFHLISSCRVKAPVRRIRHFLHCLKVSFFCPFKESLCTHLEQKYLSHSRHIFCKKKKQTNKLYQGLGRQKATGYLPFLARNGPFILKKTVSDCKYLWKNLKIAPSQNFLLNHCYIQ